MACDAKIRPFPNATEVRCEANGPHDQHAGAVHDYAYPGSETVITWQESDRRTFRGDWQRCPMTGCVLPAEHHGRHAQ